jgi:hypothetical protein
MLVGTQRLLDEAAEVCRLGTREDVNRWDPWPVLAQPTLLSRALAEFVGYHVDTTDMAALGGTGPLSTVLATGAATRLSRPSFLAHVERSRPRIDDPRPVLLVHDPLDPGGKKAAKAVRWVEDTWDVGVCAVVSLFDDLAIDDTRCLRMFDLV